MEPFATHFGYLRQGWLGSLGFYLLTRFYRPSQWVTVSSSQWETLFNRHLYWINLCPKNLGLGVFAVIGFRTFWLLFVGFDAHFGFVILGFILVSSIWFGSVKSQFFVQKPQFSWVLYGLSELGFTENRKILRMALRNFASVNCLIWIALWGWNIWFYSL